MFDAEDFAAQLRQQLAGGALATRADAPMPTAAPAPVAVTVETKGDAGPFRWRMVPVRDAQGFITAVDIAPTERVVLP